MKKQKIAVAMSGGVDSSVTSLLLKEQGYDVTGVIMQVWSGDASGEVKVNNSCYGPDEAEDIASAQKTAKKIGVPLKVIDLRDEYQQEVLEYFKKEYAQGRTPNPCVKCNWKIKFGALLEKAKNVIPEMEYFATGHYVRVEYDPKVKRYLLKRGKDPLKDQSYFLAFLKQEQLKHCLFPIGNFTKTEIKEKAKQLNLGLEEKAESQNFAALGHESLLQNTSKPGNFIDESGKIIGKHRGVSYYTIGQRRGLGIAWAYPLYVIKIIPEDNTVILGPKEKLFGSKLMATDVNWIAFEKLTESIEVTAKIRYVQRETTATLTPQPDGKLLVEFHEPQNAITPGQIVVFYREDLLIGGGVILEALNS
ncbi:tRNA 2-thiouridine(34) synthase MnmA [Candidatus Margulisiibacteriota bacterium]